MNPNKLDRGCWQGKAKSDQINSLPAKHFKSECIPLHKPAIRSQIESVPPAGALGREGAVVGVKDRAGDKARKSIFNYSDKEQMT